MVAGYRFRAKRQRLKRCEELLPESRGQSLALTVLHVPHSLGRGLLVRVDAVWVCGDCCSFFTSSVLLSSLELSDAQVYEPSIRALLGTDSHFCEVAVLEFCLTRQLAPGDGHGEGGEGWQGGGGEREGGAD